MFIREKTYQLVRFCQRCFLQASWHTMLFNTLLNGRLKEVKSCKNGLFYNKVWEHRTGLLWSPWQQERAQVPRPKQGRLDIPRHFFRLLSRDSEHESGCSHFFPAHPSLQSHLPQLHCPWPGERQGVQGGVSEVKQRLGIVIVILSERRCAVNILELERGN